MQGHFILIQKNEPNSANIKVPVYSNNDVYFWQEEDVSDFVHKSANKNKKKGKKKQNETQAVHIVVSKDKVW